ncbi:SPOR domain-containing protein [Novosphingopyxis iocasae]|uniref:SPOR domain-containing protein n=1 Tax=Novosphingopyxis iocasae TaxID=2762729 RepID=UPI0016510C5A|nr:SPOR domain-containing protein [Novosphingopyxis iocasae]
MKASIFVRLATSGALFALTTVGCSTVTPGQLSAASDAPRPAKNAAKAQARAEKALSKGHNDDAIDYAEAAVLTDPDNPQLRSLLGQAYLAAGRFDSAGDSFREAMTLGQSDPRSVIGLALTQTARGQVGAARQTLDQNRAVLPDADYGLALALAGDSKRAVEVLTTAIRTDASSAKTRQNLALAYALDGRWREARIMAAQDMSADQVEKRIASWAQMARPGAYQTRVAGLLGVAPVADAGRPIGLALDFSNQPQAEMVASVAIPRGDEPLPAVGPAPAQGGKQIFAAQESDVSVSPASSRAAPEPRQPVADRPVRTAAAAPVIKAPAAPAKAAPIAKPSPAPVKLAAASSKPGIAARSSAPQTGLRGSHLVQIGAFSSPANAAKAWEIYQRRYPALKGYSSASAKIAAGGKTLYRLAAMGFDDAASAQKFCTSLKSEGGRCIVRNMRGGGAVQYAAGTMTGRVLASR